MLAELERDQLGELVDEVDSGRSSTRPTSRTTALAAMVPKVAICDTAVGAVLLLDVVDDAVAAVLAEVDVEVGHRHALGIEEALEQQLVAQRVEVGDAAASRRPANPRPSRARARPARRCFFAQLMKSATIRK